MEDEVRQLQAQVSQLASIIERVDAHARALERIVRNQLPVTPEQWNRLVAEALRAVRTETD